MTCDQSVKGAPIINDPLDKLTYIGSGSMRWSQTLHFMYVVWVYNIHAYVYDMHSAILAVNTAAQCQEIYYSGGKRKKK